MIIKLSNGVPHDVPRPDADVIAEGVKFYALNRNLFDDLIDSDLKIWSPSSTQPNDVPALLKAKVTSLLKARGLDVNGIVLTPESYDKGKQIHATLADGQVIVFDYKNVPEQNNTFQLTKVYASNFALSNQLARQHLPLHPKNLKGLVNLPLTLLQKLYPDGHMFTPINNSQFLLQKSGNQLSGIGYLAVDMSRVPVVVDGKRYTKISDLPPGFDSNYKPEFYQQECTGMLKEHLLLGFLQASARKSGLSAGSNIVMDSAVECYTENGVSHYIVLERNYAISQNPFGDVNKDIHIPGYIVFDYQVTDQGYIVTAYASLEMNFFLNAYSQEKSNISLLQDESAIDQAYKNLVTNAYAKVYIQTVNDINDLKTTITRQLSELRRLDEHSNNFMETGIMHIDTTYANIDKDFSNLIDECIAHAQELTDQGKLELALEYVTQIKAMCTILDTGLTQKKPKSDVNQELVESYHTFKQTTGDKHERSILKFLMEILRMISSSNASNTASQQTPTYLLKDRQASLGEIIKKLPPEPPTLK